MKLETERSETQMGKKPSNRFSLSFEIIFETWGLICIHYGHSSILIVWPKTIFTLIACERTEMWSILTWHRRTFQHFSDTRNKSRLPLKFCKIECWCVVKKVTQNQIFSPSTIFLVLPQILRRSVTQIELQSFSAIAKIYTWNRHVTTDLDLRPSVA